MFAKIKAKLSSYKARVAAAASALCTVLVAIPVHASSSSITTSSGILEESTTLLTWALTSMTSIINWAINNPYVIILLVMFIVGFAVSMLARVIYSL